ncbi:MAG: MgtC/SapB family protein [Gaiellaceae bacterium]
MTLLAAAIPSLNWDEALLRLALAAVFGGVIGIERELRDREAGFRTHLLVSLGSAVFTLVSAYAWSGWHFSRATGVSFDPTRIAAQIVTGIGFLGAGTIIRHGTSVRGLTTAATLWTVAAIGMASGAGYYSVAALATAMTLFVLWPLRIVAYRVFGGLRSVSGHLLIELREGGSVSAVLARVEQQRVHVHGVRVREPRRGRRRVELELALPHGTRMDALADGLLAADEVAEVEWET